jgi:DNA topoisomerase IA
MKLFIVESPSKCGKLKAILGNDYHVLASVGHIRSIPKKGLNIDVKNNFSPTFEISSDKKKVVKELKEAATKAESIILATDPDREGEAIAWHIYDLFNQECKKKCKRVTFDSITKDAVMKGMKNQRDIDMDQVHAQQARQILDRLVGYKISPVLWFSVGSGTSAGRVQSIALKFVCQREKEIIDFKPTDFWYIDALLQSKNGDFWAKVVTKDKDNRYLDEQLSKADLEKLNKSKFNIDKIDLKEKKTNAYAPFDTSSMLQAATSNFGWSVKKATMLAQKLYESGMCFLPGTYVMEANGKIDVIENLSNATLPTINRNNYETEQTEGEMVSFDYDGNIIQIKTSNNKISVTPEHILPVYDSLTGEIIDKRTDSIKCTDFLLRKKQNVLTSNDKLDLFDILSQMGEQDKEKIRLVMKKGVVKQIKNVKSYLKDYKESTVYKLIRNDTVPFIIVERLISSGIINRTFVKDNYDHITYKHGASKPLYMPYCLPVDFYYIAGLIASDGSIYDDHIDLSAVYNKNPLKIKIQDFCDIKSILDSIFSSWGVSNSSTNGMVYKTIILSKLFFGLGIPASPKSDKIDIPELLLKYPNDSLQPYIAGLWDGDGYFTFNTIRDEHVSIQGGYTSKSKRIINQLMILLSSKGVESKIYEDPRTKISTLKISIYDIPLFYRYIKDYLHIKNHVYDKLLNQIEVASRTESPRSVNNVPINEILVKSINASEFNKNQLSKLTNSDMWCYTRMDKQGNYKNRIPKSLCLQVSKLINVPQLNHMSEFVYEKIDEISTKEYEGKVYCFKTDNDYFQFSNGIWTHNCSYIRTDSFNISDEAMSEVRNYIEKSIDKTYLPSQPNVYKKKSKAAAQEAHECIRPTHCDNTGSLIDDTDEKKLYELIRSRFIACQMKPMIMDTVSYTIKADCGNTLIAKGQTVKFDGWSKVYKYTNTQETELPIVKEGEKLDLKDIKMTKHTTQPPSRYNEASLVKKMESEGVGRPSTYSSIMESIQKRGYVEKAKGKGSLGSSELGMRVFDFLELNFKDFFMDVGFTVSMEDDLSHIAEGDKDYLSVIQSVYDILQEEVKKVKTNDKNAPKNEDATTGEKCQVCEEGFIVKRHGKFGDFFACNKYPTCKTAYLEIEEGKFQVKEKKVVKSTGNLCPECKKKGMKGELLERKNKRDGSIFFGCSLYPKCRYTFSPPKESNGLDDLGIE